MTTALALTTSDLLFLHPASSLSRPAVVDGDRRLTYGDVSARADAFAARLMELGVARGDRIIVHLRKSAEEIVALFGCWRVGAVVVNVNAHLTVEQLRYVAKDSGARVIVIDARKAKELTYLPEPIEHAIVAGDVEGSRLASWPVPGDRAPERHLLDTDLAAILYTSGSTGAPKGVMLTHANLLVGARSVARFTQQTCDDRLLSLLPFSFDYGLNQLLTAFLLGARVVIIAVPMPSVIADTIQREEVTAFAAVPPTWVQVARYLKEAGRTLPSLRYVTNSGGKIPMPTLQTMAEIFPSARIHLMYGLTEAFRSTTLDPDKFSRKMGAIGQAVPNVETFVVVHGRGLAGPGEEGELVHRGSFISRGYWGRPEETDEKIRSLPELHRLIGEEKVVLSGDLVRIDADGDMWFIGRNDSMIKSLGFRISPTEVEDIVHRSGLVSQVVAFGVEDELAGQVVEICVSCSQPCDDRIPLSKTILSHARAHMPHYMIPRCVHLWHGEMPRTASGKIDVPVVIKACKSGEPLEPSVLSETKVEKSLRSA